MKVLSSSVESRKMFLAGSRTCAGQVVGHVVDVWGQLNFVGGSYLRVTGNLSANVGGYPH